MIWALFLLLLVPVVLLIIIGGDETAVSEGPVSHYQQQLAELEKDIEKKRIGAEHAAATRLEIQRRMLRLSDHFESRKTGASSGAVLSVFIAFLLIGGSFYGYWKLGRPNLPSRPGDIVGVQETLVAEDGPSFSEAIEKLQAHLAKNPDDIQGWTILAKSARAVRSYSVAANAFAELVRLSPDDSNLRVQQLESYIAMAHGQITPAANLILQALLAKEPNHPAGQYYLGLARLQDGDSEAAKEIWQGLADRSPEDAPWLATVRARLQELDPTAPPILSEDQINSVAGMAPDQQEAFMRSMVARLEARLDSDPDDVEGWLMLARSKASLEDKEAAKATLRRAINLVSPDKRPQLQAFLDKLEETPNP